MRAFTIVPARDRMGSNAVLCSPADAVPLRFGDDSFFPHLDAARARGIEPEVVRLPRIALDIDTPEDLALFLRAAGADLLDRWDADLAAEFGKATPPPLRLHRQYAPPSFQQARRFISRSWRL